jgi:hypothetical protein
MVTKDGPHVLSANSKCDLNFGYTNLALNGIKYLVLVKNYRTLFQNQTSKNDNVLDCHGFYCTHAKFVKS